MSLMIGANGPQGYLCGSGPSAPDTTPSPLAPVYSGAFGSVNVSIANDTTTNYSIHAMLSDGRTFLLQFQGHVGQPGSGQQLSASIYYDEAGHKVYALGSAGGWGYFVICYQI